VIGLARILVDQFMQSGHRRHRVQQQHQTDQQNGEHRPARAIQPGRYVLQSVCNIAEVLPPARLVFELEPCCQDIPPGIPTGPFAG